MPDRVHHLEGGVGCRGLEVGAEDEGDFGFDPGLDKCHGDAAVGDAHGVEQRAVVGLVDPHLITHRPGGVAELGADAVRAAARAQRGQLALHPVGSGRSVNGVSMWSKSSPAGVLSRHPYHQGGEGLVDRWASGPVRVGPLSAHEAAVPAQNGSRSNKAVAAQLRRQPSDEGGEDGPVRPVQAWSWVGTAKYRDLMP